MSQSPYDEVGTRTRQAWLRTGLGIVAVTFLAARGLVLAEAPTAVTALALMPGVVAIAVVVLRMRRLGPGLSPAMGRGVGVLLAVSVLGIAAAGVAASTAVQAPTAQGSTAQSAP